MPYVLDFVQVIHYILKKNTHISLYLDNVHALVGDWHSFQVRANVLLLYFVRL